MVELFNVIIGIVYFSFAAVLYLLNGLLLLTLMNNKDISKNTSRILKSICISCMMQLFVFTLSAAMTIVQSTFSDSFDKVLGVVLQTGWILYVGLNLALAVDRFFVFFVFRPGLSSFLSSTLLFLCWLVSLAVGIICCFPGYGLTYGRGNLFYIWTYTVDDGSLQMLATEPYFDLSISAIVFVIYALITTYLLKIKLSFTTQQPSLKVELKIFMSAIVTFTYESVYLICGFFVLAEFEDSTYLRIGCHIAWTIECGTFVTVTLFINSTLRGRILDVVRPRRNVSLVSSLQIT
ncbi:hypothetical protein QR680_003706 [Steinernema hermaphroditum]|uniref:7TM GPCR serpentine receptor class x (Srx) domain-containing protein n=1 Tax=Steinernema hermaphroditum TaxID=289476 RepID=A0AA39LST1_9BILA|nr:hypothetical protein QR680_003706 [Steinernema hermaphroditum]